MYRRLSTVLYGRDLTTLTIPQLQGWLKCHNTLTKGRRPILLHSELNLLYMKIHIIEWMVSQCHGYRELKLVTPTSILRVQGYIRNGIRLFSTSSHALSCWFRKDGTLALLPGRLQAILWQLEGLQPCCPFLRNSRVMMVGQLGSFCLLRPCNAEIFWHYFILAC